MTDEEVAARREASNLALRAAVTEHLDAHQLLDDDEYLDTFVICSRVTDSNANVNYTATSDNDDTALDSVIGLLHVVTRQIMVRWERLLARDD